MPGSAAIAAEREPRIRAAAAVIALAYLRFLAEGDSVRASIVLASFQGFWNRYRASIVAPLGRDAASLPAALPVNGAFTDETQYAMVVGFMDFGAMTQADAEATRWGAGSMLATFNTRIRPRYPDSSALWEGYRVARGVPAQDAGGAIDAWASDFAEGFTADAASDFNALVSTLAEDEVAGSSMAAGAGAPTGSGPSSSACVPPMYWDPNVGACVYPADIMVPGITQLRRRSMPWGWYVAGAAVGLAALGLGWRVWKRRGRR